MAEGLQLHFLHCWIDAVSCIVLHCLAVSCSNLWCLVVSCGVLWCLAVCGSVLQCVAVCCSVLQFVAVCCSVLQCVAVSCSGIFSCTDMYRVFLLFSMNIKYSSISKRNVYRVATISRLLQIIGLFCKRAL